MLHSSGQNYYCKSPPISMEKNYLFHFGFEQQNLLRQHIYVAATMLKIPAFLPVIHPEEHLYFNFN